MSMDSPNPSNPSWRARVPYLPVYVAAGVLLIVLELLAVGWVARGQVERSNQQHAEANALRTRLWGCLDAGPGVMVDRCRARVMASTDAPLQDGAPVQATATQLAVWSSDLNPAPAMARSGIVPVSLVQGLR